MTTDKRLHYQCLLRQGDIRVVAWIEGRGAKPSARVELEGEDGLWEVGDVHRPGRTLGWLQENARRARKGLPSTR
jgi:hypothetical protein